MIWASGPRHLSQRFGQKADTSWLRVHRYELHGQQAQWFFTWLLKDGPFWNCISRCEFVTRGSFYLFKLKSLICNAFLISRPGRGRVIARRCGRPEEAKVGGLDAANFHKLHDGNRFPSAKNVDIIWQRFFKPETEWNTERKLRSPIMGGGDGGGK